MTAINMELSQIFRTSTNFLDDDPTQTMRDEDDWPVFCLSGA